MSHLPVSGTWSACPHCGKHVNQLEWGIYKQCPYCHKYLRLTAQQRLNITVDPDSFVPLTPDFDSQNRLSVPQYSEKLAHAKDKTGLAEAIVAGRAMIKRHKVFIGVMDSHFMMGTLNTWVGEVVRMIYRSAAAAKMPVVLFITSGGARMQEGIYSLLQMNTILAAKSEFDRLRLPSINVLTDPTMGGVSASFAFEGDVVIAEKYSQIGFAGRRVIEATEHADLPVGFQDATNLLREGLLDDVIARDRLRNYIGELLLLHQKR